MDSEELNCLFLNNPLTKAKYTNKIYSVDNVTKIYLDKFYVINGLPEKSDSSLVDHWYIILSYGHSSTTFSNSLCLIDSFGRFPNTNFLKILAKERNRPLYYLNVALQDEAATSCGLMVATWAAGFSLDMGPREILHSIFNYNPNDTTPFVYDYLASNFCSLFYGESKSIFYEI